MKDFKIALAAIVVSILGGVALVVYGPASKSDEASVPRALKAALARVDLDAGQVWIQCDGGADHRLRCDVAVVR